MNSCKPGGGRLVLRLLALLAQLALLAPALAASAFAAPRPVTPIAVDDPSWRLDSSSDGIRIYRGAVPGTGIVPLKAVMTLRGTIEEVSLVLEDIPRRREWISNFGRSVLLERPNDYDQTEYLRVSVPWPIVDRSALIRVRVTVSDDLARATIAGESVESSPVDTLPRLVRATVHASTFQMTQVGGNVEVVALVFIDPGGLIPKWIVNYFTCRVARSTLSGLRHQVGRRLYGPRQLMAMHRRMEAFRAFRERHAGTW